MQSVASTIPLVQSSRDWTPERRAKAAAHVERFVLELATDPRLPDVSAGILRALYPLHYNETVVRAVLWLAFGRGWNRDTTREAVKAILALHVVFHCRGVNSFSCWLHQPRDRTTSPSISNVAACDATGGVHVTD
jgi:hypothetical protein